jgi:hypothetical protein
MSVFLQIGARGPEPEPLARSDPPTEKVIGGKSAIEDRNPNRRIENILAR